MADEASRFRGSAPIGGHNSARQSVGTTVGKRAPPLRTAKAPGLPARRSPYSNIKSLAEFAARRRQKIGIIFPRDMRVGKNTSQAASVEFCRKATKLCTADRNPFGRKIEDFSPVICIFSRAMWMPRCDKRGLSPEKIKLRSRSGGPPPPRRAMQGPAQAGRLCFGAHFCAVPARRDPGTKKENQYFYGRKIKNHPSGRPQ